MSCSHPYHNPNTTPTFDEQCWIIHIHTLLNSELDNLEQESDIPISIFNVPKPLILISPQSYIPQQVSLGPYHFHRPELYEMERYKLFYAKRSQNQLKFQNLVDILTKFEPKFRSCYHKFLNYNSETLAWMMAIDSCFLLEFLRFFGVDDRKELSRVLPRMSRLVYNVVIRDIVMLENQIPLFLLRKTLEFQLGSLDEANDKFYAMLIGFGKEVLPFGTIQELNNDHINKCYHLLDFLYCLIVPRVLEGPELMFGITSEDEKEEVNDGLQLNFHKVISKLTSKLIQLFLTLLSKIICNLPGIILIRQLEYFSFSQDQKSKNENEDFDKHPSMEEIAIPSVAELSRAGVRFSVTNLGIFGVNFDVKTATFYLPTISLDVNTEVVMRNLVAYEACNASGPLIFTRYTELMNGIIDTKEDAKFLREKGVVLNHLKSDQDVANLWNGMSKSIRLTKVPFLDKVIEDVNNYYNGRWKVRIGKLLKRHVLGYRDFMIFLVAVFLLFFVSLQAFCSMFNFARVILHHKIKMKI